MSLPSHDDVSVILPAHNEAGPLPALLNSLAGLLPDAEIVVVDDGSSDGTADIAARAGARVVRNPYRMGNGAAIKAGARAATRGRLVLMDSDGQHDPKDIARLLKAGGAYDMTVGSRDGRAHASFLRRLANGFYNRLASWVVSQRVLDLTSGFRVVDAEKFKDFLFLLPNGFSYPTTITMAFFRAGYSVGYCPVDVHPRQAAASHISLARDGLRFLLIIFRLGVLYSPLKIFTPISAAFGVGGIAYYAYTFLAQGRFTNMGMFLLVTALLVFLIGLVSEQITVLLYSERRR